MTRAMTMERRGTMTTTRRRRRGGGLFAATVAALAVVTAPMTAVEATETT